MNTWTMSASPGAGSSRRVEPPRALQARSPKIRPAERSAPPVADRFEILGLLGTGAFGDVFRAFDRRLETVIALKSLHRMEPAALYHFKKEFRALADVHHSNLVELYELLSVEDQWFFTMELIEGFDFLEYAGLSSFWAGLETTDMPVAAIPRTAPQLRRLRSSLEQLVRGLEALHRSGNLHCDVKPSNIRVHRDGRLAVLDFGLVREIPRAHALQTSTGDVMGTPAYMSPEQARGEPMTEASDWYAVGGVLYEALVGRRPFSGSPVEVLKAKQYREPPPPKGVYPEIPSDLSDLCRRLLACDPVQRPSGGEILDDLGGTRTAETVAGFSGSTRQEVTPFVGREKELATLSRQLETTRQGHAVAVFMHGHSGLGKTAIADRFFGFLYRSRPGVVVLRGRCYERESVPYKGLDPLIDALSRYLKHLPDPEVEALVPANVFALARLFPVLERVPAVNRACRRGLATVGERGLRREARAALREILRRLGKRWPVVLFIDDLQWSDRDSSNFLEDLMTAAEPPAMLLVCCCRHQSGDGPSLLRERLARERRSPMCEVCEIEIGRLAFADVCELGRQLFDDRSPTVQTVVRALARESRGSPFFMAELVRYTRSESEGTAGKSTAARGLGISLENLIWSRIERLPAPARRLLDVVAVAGQPVAVEAACRAAEVGPAQAIVTQLQSGSLVRLHGDRHRTLEISHDRIRETTVQGLDPARLAKLHRCLATALEATGRADVETLAAHFHAAGDHQRAAELAVAAAERATEALAFDRAARLYRLAVDLQADGSGAGLPLRITLADVLAKAGRRKEAAEAYLSAAPDASGIEALELRRRAATQKLLSGDLRAFETFRQLLVSVGIRLPRTVAGTRFSFFWLRLRLWRRGLKFRQRDQDQIPAEELFRIDACWSGAGAALDPPRWLELGSRHLLLALEAGEPRRIVRALVHEVFVSAIGGRRRRRTVTLVHLAKKLAKQVADPCTLGLAHHAAGLAAYLESRWRRAGEQMKRCESLLRGSLADWELAFAVDLQMHSLWWRGQVGELLRRLPSMLTDATERGSLFAEILLRSRADWLARLASDQVEEAANGLQRVTELTWLNFGSAKFYQLMGRVEIALYRGEGAAAWELLGQGWPEIERTKMLSIQLARVEALQLHCRGALAAAASVETRDRANLLRTVRKDLRRLEAQRLGWSDALAHLLGAGAASLEGDGEEAVDRLAAAEVAFETADMELYAAVCRRRRGQLSAPAAAGEDLVAAADRWMAEQGIVNPGRMADSLAPGVWESMDSRTA